MHGQFSLQRLAALLRKDIVLTSRPALFGAVALLCVNLYNGLTSYYYVKEWGVELFPVLLLLTGFFTTSLAFVDLHGGGSCTSYLTLPASVVEKFTARFLLTLVGFFALFTLVFYLSNTLGRAVNMLLYADSFATTFTPFSNEPLPLLRTYVHVHALLLLGAVFFRRHTLLKMIVVACILSLVGAMIVQRAVDSMMESMPFLFFLPFSFFIEAPVPEPSVFNNVLNAISTRIPLLGLYVGEMVTPLFWALAYLKFTRCER